MTRSEVPPDVLQDRLCSLALEPFRVGQHEALECLRQLAAAGGAGRLMPDALHPGMALACRLLEVRASELLLYAAIDRDVIDGGAWSDALFEAPLGHHILRIPIAGLRPAPEFHAPPPPGGDDGVTLLCAAPPQAWRVHRREVFRVAAPASPPLYVHLQRGDGVLLRGDLLDLSIAGLAFDLPGEEPPVAVGQLLIAAQVVEGRYRSPFFELEVRSLAPRPRHPGHWRIGAALKDPPRDVVCSLQLTTYRLERVNKASTRKEEG